MKGRTTKGAKLYVAFLRSRGAEMVIINGEEKEAEGKTMQQYLDEEGYNTARLAVEINGEILPKAKYSETILSDRDKIEIVSFVGGG